MKRPREGRRPLPAGEHGYVMLAVILISALIVSLTLGYSRHALIAVDATEADQAHRLDLDAVGSGLALAARNMQISGALPASHQLPDGSNVSIDVSAASATTKTISVTTGTAAAPRVVNAVAEVYPDLSESPPFLTFNAKRSVWEFPGLIDISSDTTYEDADLTGILLIRKGRKLTLENCIVRGSIVSENALSDEVWEDDETTELEIKGGLIIEPGSTLAGCAIIAPDCAITAVKAAGNRDPALQFHGVVVADSFELEGHAVFHAQLVTTQDPIFVGPVDRPGAHRKPRAWPTSLDINGQRIGRLVFPFEQPDQAARNAIQGFDWSAHPAPQRQQAQGQQVQGG